MIVLVSFLIIIAIGISFYAYRNMNYDKSTPQIIENSGIVKKQVTVPDGTVINYGEGPEGGIPLLLIHGQMVS
ncbi:MAG TPA: hypothetical protein VKY40_01795, partial [Halanaerobiales bacterium]|nr:hypothetical protein [Halanaerobiales bacterium]